MTRLPRVIYNLPGSATFPLQSINRKFTQKLRPLSPQKLRPLSRPLSTFLKIPIAIPNFRANIFDGFVKSPSAALRFTPAL